ncbi:MAG: hypothetical protein JSS82_13900 [Bacteroidetes bacterium]|nr:hypothetical protein [Bacteroidota bacterium]
MQKAFLFNVTYFLFNIATVLHIDIIKYKRIVFLNQIFFHAESGLCREPLYQKMVDYVSAAVPFAFFLVVLLQCVILGEVIADIVRKWPYRHIMANLNAWASTEQNKDRTGVNCAKYFSVNFGSKATLAQAVTAISLSQKRFQQTE